jgi:thioredoxin reductase
MVTNLSRPVADVLVIGGGPAGLSTALGLARQLYTVVVFDRPSQHPAPHMHNVLTWDHQPSQKLRNAGRAEILDRYKTVTFHDVPVAAVKNLHNGTFEMMDEEQNVFVGKRVVLAQGVKTTTPDISGYDDLWGRSM